MWRNLPEAERKRLWSLLPLLASAGDPSAQAEHCVATEVCATTNRFFGTPLSRFQEALTSGALEASAVAAAAQAEAQRRVDWVDLQREHHNGMVHQLHYLKRTWTPPAPPKMGGKSSKGHGAKDDALMYDKSSGGLVRRSKTGGVGVPLGRPCLGDSRSASTASSSSMAPPPPSGCGGGAMCGGGTFPGSMGAPPRVAPGATKAALGKPMKGSSTHPASSQPMCQKLSCAAGGGSMPMGGSAAGGMTGSMLGGMMSPPSSVPADGASALAAGAPSGGLAKAPASAACAAAMGAPPWPSASSPGSAGASAAVLPAGFRPMAAPPASGGGGGEDDASAGDEVDGYADMLAPLDDQEGRSPLPKPPAKRPRSSPAEASPLGGAPGFFALVRDAMASVPQPLAPAEYIRKQVAVQAQSAGLMAVLPRGTQLAAYIRSVLIFMTTPSQIHAARTQKAAAAAFGGESAVEPARTLLEFDDPTQSYRWVGSPSDSSDGALRRMEQLHHEHFLTQHGGITGTARGLGGGITGVAGLKAPKAALTLPPGSAEQLAKLHEEEAARYAAPDAGFVYTLRDGSSATVAPIGKKGGGKAREHFLMRAERPAAVTLLALVRDAVARLPGGEGSRTDVCELLKESQYVTDGANDAQLSTVASGALDRLHYEADPCCRYEPERKLWIYLHAQRSVDSFGSAPTPSKSPTPMVT